MAPQCRTLSQMQPPDLSDDFHMRCNGIDHDLDGFRRMWNARKVLLAQPLCFVRAECLLQLGRLPNSFSTVKRSKPCRPCALCTSMLRSCCAPCVRLLCLQMQKLLQSVEFEVLDLFGRGDSVRADCISTALAAPKLGLRLSGMKGRCCQRVRFHTVSHLTHAAAAAWAVHRFT